MLKKRNPKENATHLTSLGLGNGTQSCKTYDRHSRSIPELEFETVEGIATLRY